MALMMMAENSRKYHKDRIRFWDHAKVGYYMHAKMELIYIADQQFCLFLVGEDKIWCRSSFCHGPRWKNGASFLVQGISGENGEAKKKNWANILMAI